MSKTKSLLYVSIRINSHAKTSHCSGKFSQSSLFLSRPVCCCSRFLVRQLRTALVLRSVQDVSTTASTLLSRASIFCYIFHTSAIFFALSWPLTPFHPCSRRRLSTRAVGVCLWRHWPLGQLPEGRLATSCRCTPGSVSNPELFFLPLILQELFCYGPHLLCLFAFYAQMKKKHRKNVGIV
jgi:hypothetical protein